MPRVVGGCANSQGRNWSHDMTQTWLRCSGRCGSSLPTHNTGVTQRAANFSFAQAAFLAA